MSKDTLRVVAMLRAKPDKIQEVRSLLLGLLVPTLQESGCIRYELLESEQDPAEFTFVEEWRDAAALEAHFQTAHMKYALSRIPELLFADPDIRRYRPVG